MPFRSVIQKIAQAPLSIKIGEKLKTAKSISLSGLSHLGKGLISSQLCQQQGKPLLIIAATVEEATRWALQLQAMNWDVYLYLPIDNLPYESVPIDRDFGRIAIATLLFLLFFSEPALFFLLLILLTQAGSAD